MIQIDDYGRDCNVCGAYKLWAEYHTDKTGTQGKASGCKECRNTRRRERWTENHNGCVDKQRETREALEGEALASFLYNQFDNKLKRTFNIDAKQYQEMYDKQRGLCALCFEPETKIHHKSGEVQRLAVDHDHKCCPRVASCGKCIRSLLCYSCNLVLGKVEQKPELAKRFADYLNT